MQMKGSYFLFVRATRLPWDTLTKDKDTAFSSCKGNKLFCSEWVCTHLAQCRSSPVPRGDFWPLPSSFFKWFSTP